MMTYLQGLDRLSVEEALGILRLMRDSNELETAKDALGIAVECVAQSLQAIDAQRALRESLEPPGTALSAPAPAPKGARRKPARAALDESRKPPRGRHGELSPDEMMFQ